MFHFFLAFTTGCPLKWHFLSLNMSLWGCPLHPTWELAPSGFPPAPPLGRPPPPAHTLAPSSGLLQFHPNSAGGRDFFPALAFCLNCSGRKQEDELLFSVLSFSASSDLHYFIKKCIWSHNVWYRLGLVQIKSHHCPVLGTQTLSGKLIYKYSHLKSTELVFFLKN